MDKEQGVKSKPDAPTQVDTGQANANEEIELVYSNLASSPSAGSPDAEAGTVAFERKCPSWCPLGCEPDGIKCIQFRTTFWSYLPLGLVAFGGPASYAILHERFCTTKHWVNEEDFLEYLALAQALPGPSATQLVIGIAFHKNGMIGGATSLAMWIIPSYFIMTLAGLGNDSIFNADGESPDWMTGLAPAAISLIFVAAYNLGRTCIFENEKCDYSYAFLEDDQDEFSIAQTEEKHRETYADSNKFMVWMYRNVIHGCWKLNSLLITCMFALMVILLIIGDDRINAQFKGFIYPIVIFTSGFIVYCDSRVPYKRKHIYASFFRVAEEAAFDGEDDGGDDKKDDKDDEKPIGMMMVKSTSRADGGGSPTAGGAAGKSAAAAGEGLKAGLTASEMYQMDDSQNMKATKDNFRRKSIECVIIIVVWLLVLFFFTALRFVFSVKLGNFWTLWEACYRVASIVYGGGQVILPMLYSEVVDTGWITDEEFWTGFALAQITPGPLSSVCAYIGVIAFGIAESISGQVSIFLPALLTVFAVLPIWHALVRRLTWFQIGLQGMNAASVGLLISACIRLWPKAVGNMADAIVALVTASQVAFFRVASPLAIVIGAIVGFLLSPTCLNLGQ